MKNNKNRSFIIVIILSLNLALLLSSCVVKKTYQSEEEAGINFVIKEKPKDIISNIDDSLSYLLFDGLFIEEEGKVNNSLCSSYLVSKDYKIYSFNIKKGIVTSKGNTIDANSFKSYFEYLKSKNLMENIESLYIENNSLIIKLVKEDEYYINKLGTPLYFYRNVEDIDKNIDNYYKNIEYSGPYTISSLSDESVILVKNESYEDKSLREEKIKASIIPLEEKALVLYEEGKIDIFSGEVNNQAGDKYILGEKYTIIFNGEIFKKNEEREGILFLLKDKVEIEKGYELVDIVNKYKKGNIKNNEDKGEINIYYKDDICSQIGEKLGEILEDNGYKYKLWSGSEKNIPKYDICIDYRYDIKKEGMYPFIQKEMFLYNKNIEGSNLDSKGNLILINSNKKLP